MVSQGWLRDRQLPDHPQQSSWEKHFRLQLHLRRQILMVQVQGQHQLRTQSRDQHPKSS